jgi:cholesterol transport system auxiliary component
MKSLALRTNRDMSRSLSRAAPLLAALLLGGCISFGPKVPPRLFDLTAENPAPAGTGQSGSLSSALVVEVPETSLELNVTRVPVQIDEANVAYLKKAAWVERPARLFQRLLAESIRARGNRLVFENEPGDANSERLTGRLLDMGYDSRTASVVVRYDAVRMGRGGQASTRRFESVIPGVPAENEAVGPALNRAANDVARQVAEWVG